MKLSAYAMLKNTLMRNFEEKYPTDLFIGSGIYHQIANKNAFRYIDQFNEEFLGNYDTKVNPRKKIEMFFEFLETIQESDRDSILKKFFDHITPSRGHEILASMIKADLFTIITTTTIDSMLEQALANSNLVINRDFKIFVVGEHQEGRFEELFMSYNQKIPKIVKLCGDVFSSAIRFTREERLQIPEIITETLQQHTKNPILFVGYNRRDLNALKVFNKKGMPIYWANQFGLDPEDLKDRRVIRFLLNRTSYDHQITGEEGSFNEIFCKLYQDLIRAGILHLKTTLDQRSVTILSIDRLQNGFYQLSVETTEYPLPPLKTVQKYEVSSELRNKITENMDYMLNSVFSYFGELGETSAERMFQEIKKLGRILFHGFIPPQFREAPKTPYLILETSEPYVPWELMYSDGFFALKYAFGRRLMAEATPIKKYVRTGEKRALIISDSRSDLPYTLKECDYLSDELEALMCIEYLTQYQATRINILHQLSRSFDIIHYAGHAQYGEQPGILLSDGILTPQEIVHHLEGNPVVFINACYSAKEGTENFESLPRAFLQAGTVAYVGNFWNIHDKSAAEIALEFYKEILTVPIGEAMRRARQKCFAKKNLSWASPILYGDPRRHFV